MNRERDYVAETDATQRDERLEYAENQLRRACTERGGDWDKLSEVEREAFIDDLVHEDRDVESGLIR